MIDLLSDANEYFFHATSYNRVGTSHELCVRVNITRVIIVIVAVVFALFLLLYRICAIDGDQVLLLYHNQSFILAATPPPLSCFLNQQSTIKRGACVQKKNRRKEKMLNKAFLQVLNARDRFKPHIAFLCSDDTSEFFLFHRYHTRCCCNYSNISLSATSIVLGDYVTLTNHLA